MFIGVMDGTGWYAVYKIGCYRIYGPQSTLNFESHIITELHTTFLMVRRIIDERILQSQPANHDSGNRGRLERGGWQRSVFDE